MYAPSFKFPLTYTDHALTVTRPDWIGFILLFSNVELSSGCIAASFPALRRYIGGSTGSGAGTGSGPTSGGPNSHPLVTFGGGGTSKAVISSGKGFRSAGGPDTKNGTTIHSHGDGSWERLTDMSTGTGPHST